MPPLPGAPIVAQSILDKSESISGPNSFATLAINSSSTLWLFGFIQLGKMTIGLFFAVLLHLLCHSSI